MRFGPSLSERVLGVLPAPVLWLLTLIGIAALGAWLYVGWKMIDGSTYDYSGTVFEVVYWGVMLLILGLIYLPFEEWRSRR